jgi:acetyltransferase-like isoleucine patch superfamily enzyme
LPASAPSPWCLENLITLVVKALLQKEPVGGVLVADCGVEIRTGVPVHPLRQSYRTLRDRIQTRLRVWCLNRASSGLLGRVARSLACVNTKPYHQRSHLADLTPKGLSAPSACVSHPEIQLGCYVYIGDRVVITRSDRGGPVEIADDVHLYGDTFLDTGSGGKITIGAGTHIQPGCHIHAHLSDIHIGKSVEIAAQCGLYSYDHGMVADRLIMEQPLQSKGGIFIGDGAWLGFGVTVLQGVKIGAGAVIGAGSVVIKDIPENAIAAGVPAKVIRYRES